jgi:uncharacterized PurR-regulated membrane protein YhhQ (DUF165 family)
MEGNIGVKLNKNRVIERNDKKRPVFLTGLLAIILIITYTLTLKSYEPANNIIVMGSILVYPLTFLIIAYISKYYGFKEARRSIYTSSALYIVFMLLMLICIIPKANNATSGYNAVIQYIYGNNFFTIGDTSIFYPMLGQFFSVVVAFLVSHLLYATIYNAIKNFTIEYLAVGLSIFISYILDRIIYMPILFAEGLMNGSNTFNYFIQCLTSEFMAAILCSLIIIVLYVIIISIKKAIKK